MIRRIVLVVWLGGWLAAAGVSWRHDLAAAFVEAKKRHKPLLVFVEGRYCKWCRKMDREVLRDTDVTARMKAYVPVRVWRDDADAMRRLPKIAGVPTVFFLSPDGDVLATSFGYYGKEDFLSFFPEAERARRRLVSSKHRDVLVWHDDIDEAFEEAKVTGKKVLVLVEDADCRWCKMVKKESLSKPEVKRALRRFVLLKISRSDIDIDRLPQLRGPIPSFHLFGIDKEPIDAIYGYFDAAYLKEYFEKLGEEW